MIRRLVLLVLAAVALAIVACGDDDPPLPTPTVPVVPGTPEPTATGEATPDPTEELYAPLYASLVIGDPVDLPEDATVYILEGCTDCDAPPSALTRVRKVDGEPEVTQVFRRNGLLAAWEREGVLYALECTTGVCFGVESHSGASVTLFRSLDGGDRWQPVTDAPEWLDDESTWIPTAPEAAWPEIDWTEEETGLLVADDVELHVAELDLRGRRGEHEPAYRVSRPIASSEHGFVLRWWVLVEGERWVSYLSVFDTFGSPRITYATPYLWGIAWLDADHLLVTATFGGDSPYEAPEGTEYLHLPAVVDLRAGTIHAVLDPFQEIVGRNTVVTVLSEGDPETE